MPLSRIATWASCGALLAVDLANAPSAEAAKSLQRHFPAPRWCSIISGHLVGAAPPYEFDLVEPYVFTPPGNRVTLTFTADNRNGSSWNNQRLDDVVIFRRDDLPASTEPVCYTQALDDGSEAVEPPAFPGVTAGEPCHAANRST